MCIDLCLYCVFLCLVLFRVCVCVCGVFALCEYAFAENFTAYTLCHATPLCGLVVPARDGVYCASQGQSFDIRALRFFFLLFRFFYIKL